MLWAHQSAAVEAMIRAPAFGLWWEPGVGKTAPLAVAGRRVGGRQLWITRAALRSQAAAEIARFRGDGARIQVVTEGRAWIDPRAQVVVCSYEMARTKDILRQLHRRGFQSLVLDEAHTLASPGAVTTQAIYGHNPESAALWKKIPHVWPATGTPIINYPNELWTHVSRLWPQLAVKYRTKTEWRDHFCEVAHNGFGEQIVGGRNLEELSRLWAKTGSTLKLTDVHDIPPLTIDEWKLEGDDLDLSEIPEDLLDAVREACLLENDLDGLSAPLATLRWMLALGKSRALAERVKLELNGGCDRIIIFGCHIEALQAVAVTLEAFGARLVIGATSSRNRSDAVDAFQSGTCRVLVGNIQALGTGLNLQAGRRVIFLDASWSPAQNAQAIGRCFRAGQSRPVLVSYSSLSGSIDEQVQAALSRKAKVLRRIEGE